MGQNGFSSPDWGYVGSSRALTDEIGRPIIHEPPPLVEQISGPIDPFHLVPDRVRQRHFGDLIGGAGAFGCPVTEAGTETVDGRVNFHAAQEHRHGHPRCPTASRAGGTAAGCPAASGFRVSPPATMAQDALSQLPCAPAGWSRSPLLDRPRSSAPIASPIGQRSGSYVLRPARPQPPLVQFADERRNVLVGYRLVVVARQPSASGQDLRDVAAPARRVLAMPVAARLRYRARSRCARERGSPLAFTFQIGGRIFSTCAVSTSTTGKLPMTGGRRSRPCCAIAGGALGCASFPRWRRGSTLPRSGRWSRHIGGLSRSKSLSGLAVPLVRGSIVQLGACAICPLASRSCRAYGT